MCETFPTRWAAQSATSNFTNEAEFGVRWLQRMWNDDSRTLYYQVGIGTDFEDFDYLSDHDIWRLPQVDDTYAGDDPAFQYIRNRPVFQAGPAGSKISPNLAGRLAADFAECFQVFQATNPALAKQCIFSAEHIFDLADTAPSGNLLTVAPFDFYPEGEWRDDMELGATELYFALQQRKSACGTAAHRSEALPKSRGAVGLTLTSPALATVVTHSIFTTSAAWRTSNSIAPSSALEILRDWL